MVATEKKSCDQSGAIAWKAGNCTSKDRLTPQVKRLGANNVVYCYGQSIMIDNSKEIECPAFPFSVSIHQTFQIGSRKWTGRTAKLNVQQELAMGMQSRINNLLLPGLNPFTVTVKSGNVSLDWMTQDKGQSDTLMWFTYTMIVREKGS